MPTEQDFRTDSEIVVSVYSVVLVLAVIWYLVKPWKTKRAWASFVFLWSGASVMFSVGVWYLVNVSEPLQGPVGAAVGTVPIDRPLSDYGIGPEKRMILVNLTDIGGPQFIDDDDKAHATMATYVNGVLNTTYDIGVEIKGSGKCCHFKLALGIEMWELDDSEWDGVDRQVSEFGFAREYEDYVIRRESDDPSMVLDAALLGAQPDYYDYTMVEVLYAVHETITYEGTFYFVNNPAKKDSIPGAQKFKTSVAPHEPLYIIEFELDTDSSCGINGHPDLECKYPKPAKLAAYPEAKQWVENLLTFRNASQLDFDSLAGEFVMQQAMLHHDMQDRSKLYHILNGRLKGGPLWDAEPPMDVWYMSLVDRYDQWVVLDDEYNLNWWKTWLKRYPQFSAAIAASDALDAYWSSYQAADHMIRGYLLSGAFDRELSRWNLPMQADLDKQLTWHRKRQVWMQSNLASFTERKVTYIDLAQWLWTLFTVSMVLLGIGMLLMGSALIPLAARGDKSDVHGQLVAYQSADQSADQSAEQSADQSAEQSTEQSAEQSAEQSTEQSALLF